MHIAQLAGAVEYTAIWQRCRTPPPNVSPGHDTKQSDGEDPVMLELLGMWSTPSMPSLPGPLWPRVVAPDRVLCMSYKVHVISFQTFFVWALLLILHT